MFCLSKNDPNPRKSAIDLLTFKNDSQDFPDGKAVDFLKETSVLARDASLAFYEMMRQKLDQAKG